MNEQTHALFEQHRQRLFGIAYRMSGSVTDADDLVQETYLRWQQASDDAIRSPGAWLSTVITRLSIKHLQSARVRRESYVGAWLPEPLVDEHITDPAASAALADSLSVGLLVVLETLSPTERAVFILREGFDCDFAEIAEMIEKSEANCRQILARARRKIGERQHVTAPLSIGVEKRLAPFVTALKNGDLATLLQNLAEDVVLTADGGDKPGALLRPLEGAKSVAHAMLAAIRKHGLDGDVRYTYINGLPGLVRYRENQAQAVLAFEISEERIQRVFVFSNPAKLRHLHRSPSSDRG